MHSQTNSAYYSKQYQHCLGEGVRSVILFLSSTGVSLTFCHDCLILKVLEHTFILVKKNFICNVLTYKNFILTT